ncbi:40S ribosomal protein s4-like [Forsythia ovata]|uniref:40S ribosomal protein s4-like n=1 Tax=Forsythia ovata TaxID=205694 RepID=A0ABD1RIS3_9LAMI
MRNFDSCRFSEGNKTLGQESSQPRLPLHCASSLPVAANPRLAAIRPLETVLPETWLGPDSFQKSMYCGIALDFCIAISDYPVKIFNRLPSFFDLKEGTAPLNLYVENEFHRSTRGGAGDVKSITNYSPARGLKKHLKRLNAPKHWMLDKLGGAFCPLNVMHAGSQTVIRTPQIKGVLALILILRNRLKYALTYREVIAILMQRHILVDGKVRTDKTYPAGFMAMGLSLANGELLSPSGLVFGRRTNLLP